MIELLKVFHIAAISVWVAGLVALPGLYIQRTHVTSRDALHRLQLAVRFAYVGLISPAAFIAVGSGIALIFGRATYAPWFSAKLGMVAVLVFIHVLTGLVVIRLFREGERYPVWRFVLVTMLTLIVACGILFLVLAKPPLSLPRTDIFAPGALREIVAPLNPWTTP